MAKSAIRRHHTARIKNNRKNYWFGWSSEFKDLMNKRRLGIVSKTPKVNRCRCCSNQRRYFGRSFAEMRLFQDLDE